MSDSASDTGEDHPSQGRDLDQGEMLARSLVSSKEAVEVLGAALAGPLVNVLKAQGMVPPNNHNTDNTHAHVFDILLFEIIILFSCL